MTPKEIVHHLIDMDLTVAGITRQLNERFGKNVTQNYVGMVLRGERTAYKLRPLIAKIARLKVSDIPLPPKKSDVRMSRSRSKEASKQGGAEEI